jgi:hypothetical protein
MELNYSEINPKELEGLTPREKVKKTLEHWGMFYVKDKDEDSGGKAKFDDSIIDSILELQNS